MHSKKCPSAAVRACMTTLGTHVHREAREPLLLELLCPADSATQLGLASVQRCRHLLDRQLPRFRPRSELPYHKRRRAWNVNALRLALGLVSPPLPPHPSVALELPSNASHARRRALPTQGAPGHLRERHLSGRLDGVSVSSGRCFFQPGQIDGDSLSSQDGLLM